MLKFKVNGLRAVIAIAAYSILFVAVISPDRANAKVMSVADLIAQTNASDSASLQALRMCAWADDALSGRCIAGLIQRGDVASVRHVRKLLRVSKRPEVIEAGALALAKWQDAKSHSLLLDILWSGRGGDTGAIAVSMALRALEEGHAYAEHLRFIGARMTTSSIVYAAVVNSLKRRKWRTLPTRVREQLVDVVADADQKDALSLSALRRAQVALRALVNDPASGCKKTWTAISKVKDLEARAETWHRLLQAVPRPCLKKALRWAKQSKLGAPVRTALKTHAGNRYLAAARLKCHDSERCQTGPDAYVAFRRGPKRRARTGYKVRPTSTQFVPPAAYRFNPTLSQPKWLPPSVQITIDDGLYTRYANRMLDILDQFDVKATFFWTGGSIAMSVNASPDAARAAFRRVVDGGHAIAYHTLSHSTGFKHHVVLWESDQVVDDVRAFRRLVNWMAGRDVPIKYGRLPGGDGTGFIDMHHTFSKAGLAPPVYWHKLQLKNWVGSARLHKRRATQMRKRCESYIVLLHETPADFKGLRHFLTALRNNAELETCGSVVNHFPLQDMVRNEWGLWPHERLRRLGIRRRKEGRSPWRKGFVTIRDRVFFPAELSLGKQALRSSSDKPARPPRAALD